VSDATSTSAVPATAGAATVVVDAGFASPQAPRASAPIAINQKK
jgi:hypothetical protein